MTIEVALFAAARELVGQPLVPVALPENATVAVLRHRLADEYPALAQLLARSLVAVNDEYADDTQTLAAADRVAVIPPVSGG